MGSCLSKKSACSSPPVKLAQKNEEIELKRVVEKKKVEARITRREIFVIKRGISHEVPKDEKDNFKKAAEFANTSNSKGESAPLRRTSSCTKEEVDAILIQCGRLSRSSSRKNGLSFSGSAESSDNTNCNSNRSRMFSNSHRSYDFDNENRCDGRRVSRSPGRRSESPVNANLASTDANGINVEPGKMVSLPTTRSSLMVDKNAGGAELISTATIPRIQVKRNVGAASSRARSRSQSPAKVKSKASKENMLFQQQPLYLGRSNSRKRDSPFRRNPPSENVVAEPMPFYTQKLNAQNINHCNIVLQGTEERLGTSKANLDYGLTNVYGKVKEQQQQLAQETKALRKVSGNAAVDVVASGFESLVPEGIRTNRSPRLSRDLDINLSVQSNPTQSYTELLLEDIQNFHQKSRNPSFSLPPCVTKACSIVEAVADFNSSTSSNLSCVFSADRRSNPTVETNPQGKNRLEIKDPYVESEVGLNDDLMERIDGGYMEEPESSESNSFVGYQRRRFPPSAREPNSVDSTDSWPPKSYSRLYMNPLAFQKCTVSDHRDSDNQQHGIVSNSGEPRGLHITPVEATAASTYYIYAVCSRIDMSMLWLHTFQPFHLSL
ncbi:unnamed protein product [Withania somnifera]